MRRELEHEAVAARCALCKDRQRSLRAGGFASEEGPGVTRIVGLLSSGVVALLAAGPAVAAQTSTVTATGTAQAKVLPKNRHSNASIQTAYDAAQRTSITGAVRDAQEYALDYAQEGGLTLRGLVSVSDQQSNGFYGPGAGGFAGPFGPGQFCGTDQQPIFKRVKGRQKVVGFKKVHRCIVPPFAYTTLTLTYSAS